MQMTTNINGIMTTVQDRAGETASLVKARVDDVTTAVSNQALIVRYDVLTRLDRYAREEPAKMIGMCLGAGFVLGALLKLFWTRPVHD